MRIEYDLGADAAYIYIVDDIKKAEVNKTYLCDPNETHGMINLDFDSQGQLLGIEIMDASKKLPKEILESAIRIDK